MNKLFSKCYLISILLLGAPSFFFIFTIFSSHYIVTIIWSILFLFVFIKWLYKKSTIKVDKYFLFFFLLFFVAQSASIINAQNLTEFINSYKDILLSSMFFIISLYFINTKENIRKVIYALFTVSFINILLQALILFYPNLFIFLGQLFLNENYFNTIYINIQRNRIYLDSYDEILIPVIIYYLVENKHKKILTPLSILISVFSFLSGFRTKVFMLLLSFAGTLIVFRKNIKIYFPVISILALLLFTAYTISTRGDFTSIDRLLDENTFQKDITSGRLAKWNKALEIGFSSPVFGVGLGNYFEYLDISMQKSFSLFKTISDESILAAKDPHNVFMRLFAETGIFGVGSFIALLIYFIIKDIPILIGKKSEKLSQALVLAFWPLFFFSILNPSSSLIYQSLFWLTRVLIVKSESLKI